MPPPDQPPESPPAVPVKPIAEQFTEEYLRLCETDPRMRVLHRQAEDARARLAEKNNNLRFRERQLRRKAADILRKLHGIRIVPGYNDAETSLKGALSRMPKRVTDLLKQITSEMPAGSLPPEIQTLIDQANVQNRRK